MAENSGPSNGHNSLDHDTVVTDIKHHQSNANDLMTEDNEESNVFVDPPRFSCHFIDIDDSVVYHDSNRPADDEGLTDEWKKGTFVSVVRNRSVVIAVDKWSSEPVTAVETSSTRDLTYAKVDKVKKTNSVLEKESEENMTTNCSVEGEVDAIYSVVNKPSNTVLHKSPRIDQDDNGYYGKVNKAAVTKYKDGGQKDFLNNSTDEDIGNTDDLHCNIEESDGISYAHVGGRVIVVKDEGDYASVKSLSGSEDSKATERTGSSGISVDTRITEIGRIENDPHKQGSRYAMQYLGSVPITEDQLLPKVATQTVGQCIVDIAQQSNEKPVLGVKYEWPKDAKMIMEINENRQSLRLLNSNSGARYDDHYLYSIRIWAVGKETNSKHFAYVIRSINQKHVCRVFLCDVAARHIVATIRNICQRLASQDTKKSTAPQKTYNNPTGDFMIQDGSVKTLTVKCSYMGVVQVLNPSEKDAVNAAIEKVFANIPKDNWKAVAIQWSASDIIIMDVSISGRNFKSLAVENVTLVEASTKNKSLASILVKDKDNNIRAHVFHCEPSGKEFVQQLQPLCQPSTIAAETNQKKSKIESNKQKGVKRFLFGKQTAK